MKKKFTMSFIMTVLLFCFASCERRDGQDFYVENNSRYNIVLNWGGFPMDGPALTCFSGMNEREFLDDFVVKANTVKNLENIGNSITRKSPDTIYMYIYMREDVDNMSCEEFKAKNPYKKRYALTQTDAEAMGWTITYP